MPETNQENRLEGISSLGLRRQSSSKDPFHNQNIKFLFATSSTPSYYESTLNEYSDSDDNDSEPRYNRADIFPSDEILYHLLVNIFGMPEDAPVPNFLEPACILPVGSFLDLPLMPFTNPETDAYSRPGAVID